MTNFTKIVMKFLSGIKLVTFGLTAFLLYMINQNLEEGFSNLKTGYRRYLSEYLLLPTCEWPPSGLVGRHKIRNETLPFEDLETSFPYMKAGRSKPTNCKSGQRIAIIVPYRDRLPQLKVFLINIIPYLHRQQLDFTIYIVEQAPGSRFNRGMMRNIGFREASTDINYDCYIFHDVDILPEDDRNLYNCGPMPRHLSGLVDRHGYKLMYKGLVGGILALTREQFIRINGYSNQFFVWGGEDDELYRRTKLSNLTVERPSLEVSQCTSLSHKKSKMVNERLDVFYSISNIWKDDGLNSLKYEKIVSERRKLFVWLYVKINEYEVIQERLLNPKTKNPKNASMYDKSFHKALHDLLNV